ncbi:dual specificity protein kinase yak1 [Stygiomarasmius scandens]|uniref:Dual specificity protein kinase yak1 n=1 Tax=Marasmiellus scandens TaxID=2682957 RepID=A0ABR1K764_9AGAR
MSEADYMMTDSNQSFDLPRWQPVDHLSSLSSSSQAALSAQSPAQSPSYYPPPPASRPQRVSQIVDGDTINSSQYLPTAALSRSASLNAPSRRPEPFPSDPSSMAQNRQNAFYNPSVAYQSQSSSSSDLYYPPKQSARSPLRQPNTPLLDPYSPQYSPGAAQYSYASRKPESPINSPYSPQTPAVYSSSSSYPMDTSSPNPPSSQTHLSAHAPPRKPSLSNPPTPLSYMQQSHYPQDQNMMVDPPQRRRASGFRRVREVRDLQPRLDIPPTGRRMASDGTYLSPLQQLTTSITDTYHICNPQFRYESAHNPRRVLTKPSKPAHNEGYDNDDYDYILYVNDWLGAEDGHKYLILDILGQGTFGQVVKCQNMKTHEVVAVKVVKNKPAYFNQSMMEVTILELLNKQCDPHDEHHILRLRDSFIHRNHLCLVFELLSSNLYELIKQNQFQGLSTQLVKVFMAQLLDAMTVLKEARLIHCDLKPENILLKTLQSPQIKVIDFGSACHERQTVYTYIQSRFYRSPEVLLGLSYTAAIDVWSLGCIAVELFLGLPLFPGTSEYNQLTRIIEMLGMPPTSMLNIGKQTNQFFDSYEVWNPHTNQNEKKYRLKSIEQYSREHNTNEQPGKQYFKATSLPDIINTAPMPTSKNSSRQAHEIEKEMNNRASFIDFCQGLLDMNPVTRWTPQQARMHPFITGEKFTKPFVPDGLPTQQQNSNTPDPKRPYGGLVPSQPKGTRAYTDAASYNQHLAQHQVYTAQAQSQAANTFRNPYIAQQQQQQQSSQQQQSMPSYSSQQDSTPPQGFPQPQTYAPQQPSSSGHRLVHQSSTGHLSSSSSVPQFSNPTVPSSLNPNVPVNSYYPNSRARANTINQMDAVPPALARLQHMNQDVIAGRNALTPVLNRDDAMKEWERRQSGKPAVSQPYPQLEFLQQQAELAATSGLTNWSHSARYAAPPSKLSHSYNAPPIVVEDDGGNNGSRRDAVMSNVRSAARGDGGAALYGSAGVISSPPQTYTSNTTTTGNRYMTYSQSQQSPPSAFDSVDRRTDIGNIFVPMQPDNYSTYSGQPAQASGRHVAPPAQSAAPSFYGAGVVPPSQPASNQHRNPFSMNDPSQQIPKDTRRQSGIDAWPR